MVRALWPISKESPRVMFSLFMDAATTLQVSTSTRLRGKPLRRRREPKFDLPCRLCIQGFDEGLEEDRAGLHVLLNAGLAVLVTSSYSKNFSLYSERIGAITVVEETADDAIKAFSHIQAAIRAIYSSPPAHGGKIVATILDDTSMRALWIQELADMRARIKEMRQAFAQGMAARQQAIDFDFINHQKGMFSFSGLTQEQVLKPALTTIFTS